MLAVTDVGIHAEAGLDGFEAFFKRLERSALLADKGEAHEEQTGFQIVELRAVCDVAALVRQITGDRRDDAAGGFAGNGQHIALHGL